MLSMSFFQTRARTLIPILVPVSFRHIQRYFYIARWKYRTSHGKVRRASEVVQDPSPPSLVRDFCYKKGGVGTWRFLACRKS
jgi:hypothetical protein